MNDFFEVGKKYRDLSNTNDGRDEFIRKIKGPLEKGIATGGGIRVLKSHSAPNKEERTFIILVSSPDRNQSKYDNPWEDKIDLHNGRIEYWGDAKVHDEKKYDEFYGNKILSDIYQRGTVEGKRDEVPPILFFEKPETGQVRFCGVAVIENLEMKRFMDDGQPVANYLFDLAILDEDRIPVEWIHERTSEDSDRKAPEAWKKWVETGEIDRYEIYRRDIRNKQEQKPAGKSRELIDQVNEEFSGRQFEFLLKHLLRDTDKFKALEVTPKSRDRGFDLEGLVNIPEIDFSVPFRAEAKNWADGPVRPKDVSRLASRLQRGQFGIFFTTTRYTKDSQEETHSTYPMRLISGKDLAGMLMDSNLTEDGRIKEEVISEVKEDCSNSSS